MKPFTLRLQTIVVTSVSLLLFHLLSLALYAYLTAGSVTQEREALIADRIVAATRSIESTDPAARESTAQLLSGDGFLVRIDEGPLDQSDVDTSGPEITALISDEFGSIAHVVAADYVVTELSDLSMEVTAQRASGPFRIHETLVVSVDLPDGKWVNFLVSGSPWDHILPVAAIPSLSLMALAAIFLAASAVNRPLLSLSRVAGASEAMAEDFAEAKPLDETGPVELRQVAQAFNAMQAKLRYLLRARDEMLGAVSHDFRTPLTRLRLRVERMSDPELKDRCIKDIEDMEALIQFTLDFARNQVVETSREVLVLKPLVESLVAKLSASEKSVEVAIPYGLTVLCHALGLQRVLTNLLENALFYSDRVRVSASLRCDGVCLAIEDNGPGIPESEWEQVFTPYYRLESSRNPNGGGVGLGLSIARTIIEANHGVISLGQSKRLGGLKVMLKLASERELLASVNQES